MPYGIHRRISTHSFTVTTGLFFREAFNLPLLEQPFAQAQGNPFLLQRIIAASCAGCRCSFLYAAMSTLISVGCSLFIVNRRFEDLILSSAVSKDGEQSAIQGGNIIATTQLPI